jgi:NAD(P)-dependent dehydrogenase (short-subunit alcohol dehydrogenase family)
VSIKGFAACSVYNASKAAVRSFARTWIVDLKGRDIRVNVLSTGYTDTPGMSHFMTDEEKAAAVATVPLGRMGTPDDLGKAAVFDLPIFWPGLGVDTARQVIAAFRR